MSEYADWSVRELRNELVKRGEPSTGRKDILVKRLETHDTENSSFTPSKTADPEAMLALTDPGTGDILEPSIPGIMEEKPGDTEPPDKETPPETEPAASTTQQAITEPAEGTGKPAEEAENTPVPEVSVEKDESAAASKPEESAGNTGTCIPGIMEDVPGEEKPETDAGKEEDGGTDQMIQEIEKAIDESKSMREKAEESLNPGEVSSAVTGINAEEDKQRAPAEVTDINEKESVIDKSNEDEGEKTNNEQMETEKATEKEAGPSEAGLSAMASFQKFAEHVREKSNAIPGLADARMEDAEQEAAGDPQQSEDKTQETSPEKVEKMEEEPKAEDDKAEDKAASDVVIVLDSDDDEDAVEEVKPNEQPKVMGAAEGEEGLVTKQYAIGQETEKERARENDVEMPLNINESKSAEDEEKSVSAGETATSTASGSEVREKTPEAASSSASYIASSYLSMYERALSKAADTTHKLTGKAGEDKKDNEDWYVQIAVPDKSAISKDMLHIHHAKLVNVYPVTVEDLYRPEIMGELPKCEEFSINYYHRDRNTLVGILSLMFKEIDDANDAKQQWDFGKDINIEGHLDRDKFRDVIMSLKEKKKNEDMSELLKKILYVAPLPKDTTRLELVEFFPDAEEITILNSDTGKEHKEAECYAYVRLPDKDIALRELKKMYDPVSPYKLRDKTDFYVSSCLPPADDPLHRVMRRDKRQFHLISLRTCLEEEKELKKQGKTPNKEQVRYFRRHYKLLADDEDMRTYQGMPLLDPTLNRIAPHLDKRTMTAMMAEETDSASPVPAPWQDKQKPPPPGTATFDPAKTGKGWPRPRGAPPPAGPPPAGPPAQKTSWSSLKLDFNQRPRAVSSDRDSWGSSKPDTTVAPPVKRFMADQSKEYEERMFAEMHAEKELSAYEIHKRTLSTKTRGGKMESSAKLRNRLIELTQTARGSAMYAKKPEDPKIRDPYPSLSAPSTTHDDAYYSERARGDVPMRRPGDLDMYRRTDASYGRPAPRDPYARGEDQYARRGPSTYSRRPGAVDPYSRGADPHVHARHPAPYSTRRPDPYTTASHDPYTTPAGRDPYATNSRGGAAGRGAGGMYTSYEGSARAQRSAVDLEYQKFAHELGEDVMAGDNRPTTDPYAYDAKRGRYDNPYL